MKLYYAPGACSLAIHIALREVGAPFELVRADLRTHKLEDGRDLAAVSPRGYVPVLEMPDGSRHTEGASLLQYVADLDPERRLIGVAGSPRRLTVIGWLTFVATELHQPFGWLFHRETPEGTRAAVMQRLDRRFAEIDRRTVNSDWLDGHGYSVADAYAFTVLSWAGLLRLSLDAYPALQAFVGRVGARPAVRAALVDEGLAR